MGKKTKTTQQVKLPEWMNEAGQFLVGQGKELASSPYEPYGGARVADFTGDQTNAFQALRNLIAGAPQVGPEMLEGIRTAANAPAQVIGTERLVDEGGRLGEIADYTDPFMTAAEGPVQSAIRRITEAADAARKRLGAGATSAGAFGDARHGIREAMLDRDTSLAIGETAGNLYGQAFRDAMGQRAGDLNRFLQADTTGAGFAETALNRLLGGSMNLGAAAQGDQTRMLQQIQALLGSGALQQANEQLGLDRDYDEFLQGYQHDFNVINALAQALGAAPKETTTVSTQPDNSGIGVLGSLVGSALAPVPAGSTTAIASLLAGI